MIEDNNGFCGIGYFFFFFFSLVYSFFSFPFSFSLESMGKRAIVKEDHEN